MKTPSATRNNLDQEEKIVLSLLDAVDENSAITQRSMASELGIALGLTNSYLKRCAKKGFIKVQQAPANRYAYYLTPHGFAEKSRLTKEYLRQSFSFFRQAREQSSKLLKLCVKNGWTRIALAGKSDLTEITIISATELKIELVGIISAETALTTSSYMNVPVVSKLPELGTLHSLIVTNMERPQEVFDEAILFFQRDQVLTAPILGVNRGRKDNQPIATSGSDGEK